MVELKLVMVGAVVSITRAFTAARLFAPPGTVVLVRALPAASFGTAVPVPRVNAVTLRSVLVFPAATV